MTKKPLKPDSTLEIHYDSVVGDISKVIDAARSSAARSVNYIMTAAYWFIGRRIVEFEQKGSERADYGEELLKRLSRDLTSRYGRGFAKSNLYQMRSFYMAYQDIFQTPSGISDTSDSSSALQNFQTASGTSELVSFQKIQSLAFQRRLRCLVVIDLKIGKFSHADAGQMHLYLNYAREHWVHEGENPPVGLILCARKDEAVALYALEGLPNKVLASEYRTVLPDEKELAAEIERTQAMLERRSALTAPKGPRKKNGTRRGN